MMSVENAEKTVVKPKVRGFVCVTTHPEGCAANVREQVAYIQGKPQIKDGPKNVLVIGSSTGYGLSSRISAAFGCNANTLGVFFERKPDNGRPGSAGWYNTAAFTEAAEAKGLYSGNINGDAFSAKAKEEALRLIKENMGPIDLVVYSLASPRRTDPVSGETYKSVLKPIGNSFSGKSLDTDKVLVTEVSIEPASEEEIEATRRVMGGEDWELWMNALNEAGVLAENCKTVAYSYLGPQVTWAIYKDGTIGKAKEDLERAARAITESLKPKNGAAYISVNKALVTQASSAIPVVPLYISLLFKVMKEKGIHEGCIEQMYRLFAERLYNKADLQLDEEGRIRVDDWEMRDDVQKAVFELWPRVSSENISEISDFKGYQEDFLKLFGFANEEINYDEPVSLEKNIENVVEL